MSIRGKQIVITGATSGIGEAAAHELVRRGANLAVIGRNSDRLAALTRALFEVSPSAEVSTYLADLSDLDQVVAAAASIRTDLGHVDVLINNAGIVARSARTTAAGLDELFAANYLGPFVLTELLLDVMRNSAPSRIVITGSEAHRSAGPFDTERFEHFGDYGPRQAQARYGRTKLLNLLWADELARRLEDQGVSVNSLCPGMVASPLWREVPAGERLLGLAAMTPFVNTSAQGARMIVHLAAEIPTSRTGHFHSSTAGAGLLPTVRSRRDPAIAARVYERSLELVADHLPTTPRRTRRRTPASTA